jgi:hypothetical protein
VAGGKANMVDVRLGISTGRLAGNKAIRVAVGKNRLHCLREVVVSDIIACAQKYLAADEGKISLCQRSRGKFLRRLRDMSFFQGKGDRAC